MTYSARDAAWHILARFERRAPGRRDRTLKADALLQACFAAPEAAHWPASERGFCTALTYGALRRWRGDEARLSALSQYPLAQLDPAVRALLRLGLVQLLACEDIPDYAALNETVAQARRRGLSRGTVAFINGVLRSAQRQRALFAPPSFDADPIGYLVQVGNLPPWLAARWRAQYGDASARAMAEALACPLPLTLRVNTLVSSPQALRARLTEAGIACQPAETEDLAGDCGDLPECLTLSAAQGNPSEWPGYDEGAFYVQDANAMRVSRALAVQPGHTVVDLCAAPGGKTTHLAALMGNQGVIWAIESVARKLERLQENIARLNARIIRPVCADAHEWTLPDGVGADRVLVDAPCSGLGTLRRHPEILLQLTERDVRRYAAKQRTLLAHGLSLLAVGGQAVYATCSVDASENGDVVRAVLQEATPGGAFRLIDAQQYPIGPGGDGFYIACLRREA